MTGRLSDEQVAALREKFRAGTRQADLAIEYGIRQNTVSSIVTGGRRLGAGGPISRGSKRKLTAEDVVGIRRALSAGTRVGAISAEYGITQQMVSQIQTGRAYADVRGPVQRPARRAEPLTVEQVTAINRRVGDGERRPDVATAFGISPSTVNAVMTGRISGRVSGSPREFSEEEIREIRTRYPHGVRQKELGQQFGLTQQAISQIVRGAMYPDYGVPIAGKRRRRLTSEEVVAIREASRAGVSIRVLAERASHDACDHRAGGDRQLIPRGSSWP
jgi:plasmid maintenance system antidote protein VapI